MTIDTLRQLNDLMTVLNNTKAKLDKGKVDKPDLSFNELLTRQVEDPVKQSSITQTIIKPMLQLSIIDTSCSKCGKPGKYMLRGKWYCKECADGIQE